MKKLYALFVLLVCYWTAMATSVTYTADNTTIFRNPERGFTEEIGGETMLTRTNNHLLKNKIDDWFFDEDGDRETQTLVMMIYYLGNFRSQELPDEIVTGFNEDMQVLREKGFKCVLRFAYDWNSNNDATVTWTKRHIAKLQNALTANADVIYVLETGFVGQWGEWYYSSNHTNESQRMNDNRRQILQAMLDACPADRFLLVRYGMIKTEFLGHSTALTASQAYNANIPQARLGYHNDAFLNDWGNAGTYASTSKSDDPAVRTYIANETLYVPNGGETNVEDNNLARTVYTQAESEMSTYHWSFCGSQYATEVTDRWRSSGIYQTLDRNMGYRYQLVSGTYSDQATAGGTMSVNISLKNVGYAPLYNERPVYIVLKNGTNTYSVQLQSDPRTWLPNGATTTINETLTLPSNIPTGTYQLYLNLPDKYASLASDPRFSVRFANTGVWDASTGMNNLNASITVSAGAVATPALSLSKSSASFGSVTIGSTTTQTFTVTGSNLTNNVTISSSNAALTVSPTNITRANAQAGATVTLSLTPTVAGSGTAMVTVASTGATSQTVSVSWTATSNSGSGGNSSNGIQLPTTLDKSNVSDYINTMTWYNTEYFDFGPTDAGNLDRWATWNVWLRYPGQYIISEVSYCDNGHNWSLELMSGNTVVSSYATVDCAWGAGNQSCTQTVKWDLSNIAAGEYTIRVKNATEWGQPKLKSITLDYDGEIPDDPDPIPNPDPSGSQVTYTVDNSTIFANPERGFYYHYEQVLTTDSPYAVKNNESQLTTHANDKGSLILIVYYLDNFKSTATLPSQIINAFDEDMQVLRNYGMKAIVRYAYTNSNANDTGVDAPLNIVQQHISQLAPKWQANADVIYCFQVGFVGSWGEWYYSQNFGNHVTTMNANRRSVVDALLDAVPADRTILIRTPLFKTGYIGNTTPLSSSEAYTGTAKARIGHHNDAFLYGGQDQGTYSDTATQKPYLAQETLYVPNGGETNETRTAQAQTKASYANTIAETSRLHYTFINQGYAPAMTNQWRSNGTYDSLRVHLGYRFQLLNGTYTTQAAPGGTMSVYMQIKNVGFAPLYNERTAYIVLKNNDNTYSIPLTSDPRRWKPNGVVSTVNEELVLPANIATGTYQLYLYLPDAYSTLASNPSYAVRFANNNIWEASTGMNKLNASIVIANNSSTPSLSVSPTSVAFGDVMVATTSTNTISVSGANLTENATISSNNAALTVSPASLTPAQVAAGAAVTLSLTPSNAGSGNATVTISSTGAVAQTVNITWNGMAVSGAVELPATLNKANYSAVSNNLTWYNTDYFNLNPGGIQVPTAYAEWSVYLSYPAEYSVSETGYYTDGHQYRLQLLNGNNVISEYTTTATWTSGGGDLTFPQTTKWNLSTVPAGVYTLRVTSAMEWSHPNLKSITLECEALLTSHTITWNATANGGTCATATSEIAIGDPIGTLPIATKTGYVFIGWFSSATNGSMVNSTDIPTANVTYYAQFLPIPQLTGTTVDLPNTLNKVNMGEVSENMAWWGTNSDYFDIGPGDAPNIYSWAAWRVNLIYPGSYTVTEETNCSNGHQYIMQLFSGNNLVAEYTMGRERATTGDQIFTQATPWDLSSVPAGNYVLMIRSIYPYSQPKLKRVTLDIQIPTYLYYHMERRRRKHLADGSSGIRYSAFVLGCDTYQDRYGAIQL